MLTFSHSPVFNGIYNYILFLPVSLVIIKTIYNYNKNLPKSFAAEKSSMPNNLVSLKPAGVQRRIEIALNNNQFLYKTWGDDVISHVTLL